MGLLGYLAGQVFGPGVASAPLGIGLAQSSFTQVLRDHDSSNHARARALASAIHVLVSTTIA